MDVDDRFELYGPAAFFSALIIHETTMPSRVMLVPNTTQPFNVSEAKGRFLESQIPRYGLACPSWKNHDSNPMITMAWERMRTSVKR